MFSEKNASEKKWKWSRFGAIIFFIAIPFGVAASYLTFEKNYQGKIYPHIYVGDIDVGGKTPEEAEAALNNKMDGLNQNGVIFYYGEKEVVVYPLITSPEGDIARQVIIFDATTALDGAFQYGRGENFFVDLRDKFKILTAKKRINLSTNINREEITKILSDGFSFFDVPAENAKLTYAKNLSFEQYPDYPVKFSLNEEKLGKVMDYERAVGQLTANLSSLNFAAIRLLSKTDYPSIYKADCPGAEAEAEKILSLAPLTLKLCQADNASSSACEIAGKKEWMVEKNQLADWIALQKKENEVTVGLNSEAVKQFLSTNIAPDIDRKSQDAKFEIKNGRVTEFQASRDGQELDMDATIKNIEAKIKENSNQAELVIKEVKSSVSAEEVNNLGVKEIIGTGKSNFAGSPANRRHNIRTGAAALNGLLIKPDEEFSLNKALGEIDASTGYLPELVIKDNKTTPEYGGGLCQVGTTMFRGALATGLSVTARQNHSYRVSYYEPAGTDATIYDPWPDLKFINDTGNHILIQARIEGDNLYFDFWGTKDGRAAEQTKPTIYNIVKPGSTKLIETLDLKPGEKKCTEKPHNGADAYFDYKVTYANGEIKEKRFKSHYVPWREVCLIGVEKLSEPVPTDSGVASTTTATGTPVATSTTQ